MNKPIVSRKNLRLFLLLQLWLSKAHWLLNCCHVAGSSESPAHTGSKLNVQNDAQSSSSAKIKFTDNRTIFKEQKRIIMAIFVKLLCFDGKIPQEWAKCQGKPIFQTDTPYYAKIPLTSENNKSSLHVDRNMLYFWWF